MQDDFLAKLLYWILHLATGSNLQGLFLALIHPSCRSANLWCSCEGAHQYMPVAWRVKQVKVVSRPLAGLRCSMIPDCHDRLMLGLSVAKVVIGGLCCTALFDTVLLSPFRLTTLPLLIGLFQACQKASP